MNVIDRFQLRGIYGGTFDPIHYGHLRIAEELLDLIGLEKILFVPSGSPRLRADPSASRSQRAAMVHLAIQNNTRFLLDEREIKRLGISTSVQTLREYRLEWGESVALCLVLGIDAFIKLDQWSEWHELFNLCHLILVVRPGYMLPIDNHQLPNAIRQELVSRYTHNIDTLAMRSSGCIYIAQTSLLDISASKIRSLIESGKSIRYLLPERVIQYIYDNCLYTKK